MKVIRPKSFIRLIGICVSLLVANTALAFYVDGFSYQENFESGSRSVTVYDIPDNTDEITIPQKIVYEGTTYTVTKISLTLPRMTYEGYYDKISIINIPSTIKDINLKGYFHRYGAGTSGPYFIGEWFKNLSKINVDENNPYYKSDHGILYSKDGKTLLYCPSKNTSNMILSTTEVIGESAFYYSIIKEVNLPFSVYKICNRAFFGSSIKVIEIPESVTEIEDETFAFSDIERIILPETITSIGNKSFQSSDLNSINLPSCLNTIGSYAFEYCKFTELKFPISLRSIGDSAFRMCTSIKQIYCQWETPIYTSNVFPDNVISSCILYVPKGRKQKYEATSPWRNFWNIEEFDSAGIEDIYTDSPLNPVSSKMYDLMGREIKTPTKGNIFISNGKKVLIH